MHSESSVATTHSESSVCSESPVANPVVSDASYVVAHADHVSVRDDAVVKAADEIADAMPDWRPDAAAALWSESPLNPNPSDVDAEFLAQWIFLVSTLNFSFWSDKPASQRFTVAYNGESYTGYWSLLAALRRALEEGIPVTSASWQATCTAEQLEHIFRSETAEGIPLFAERLGVLHEAGRVLQEKYQGSFANVVAAAQHSAMRLVELVTSDFPSYDDRSVYKGRTVVIRKRAQILVAELWASFAGRSYGQFHDIGSLSMFADYRVPQMLCTLRLLHYSTELREKLGRGELLQHGSPQEVEIRCASIVAVERIVHELRRRGLQAKALQVDFWLWDTAKLREGSAHTPVHRTRSIYY